MLDNDEVMSFTETFSSGLLKESSDSCKMEVVSIVRPCADHTGVEQLKNKMRMKIKMVLPLPFCTLDSKATFQ